MNDVDREDDDVVLRVLARVATLRHWAGEYVLTMVLFSRCYDPISIDRVSVLMGWLTGS